MRWRQKEKVRLCASKPAGHALVGPCNSKRSEISHPYHVLSGRSEQGCSDERAHEHTVLSWLLGFHPWLAGKGITLLTRAHLQGSEGSSARSLALAAAGANELVCAIGQQAFVWSAASQQIVLQLLADDMLQQRCSIACAPECKIIASGLAGKHPVVLVWQRSAPSQPVARLKAHRFDIISLAFDSQGDDDDIISSSLDMPILGNQQLNSAQMVVFAPPADSQTAFASCLPSHPARFEESKAWQGVHVGLQHLAPFGTAIALLANSNKGNRGSRRARCGCR